MIGIQRPARFFNVVGTVFTAIPILWAIKRCDMPSIANRIIASRFRGFKSWYCLGPGKRVRDDSTIMSRSLVRIRKSLT